MQLDFVALMADLDDGYNVTIDVSNTDGKWFWSDERHCGGGGFVDAESAAVAAAKHIRIDLSHYTIDSQSVVSLFDVCDSTQQGVEGYVVIVDTANTKQLWQDILDQTSEDCDTFGGFDDF